MSAVLFQQSDGIVELTFNRPKFLNALNLDMINQLNEVMDELEQDSKLRVVILKGTGNHFMAGGDIAYFHELLNLDMEAQVAAFTDLISRVHRFVVRCAQLPVPTVASVRGAAAGFGISAVAGTDLAVASENAMFTSAYCYLGTSPDGGSTYYLPRAMGMKKAMEVVLLSERLNAETAREIGLVNKVVADSELENATLAIAQTFVRSAPTATSNAKQLIRRSFARELEQQLHSELDCFLECVRTPNFAEGVRAFVEKRRPEFSN